MISKRPGHQRVYASNPGAEVGGFPLIESLPGAPAWTARATCRDVDPEAMFPRGGEDTDREGWQAAREVCSFCPVRQQCLDWQMEFEGEWAGSKSRFGMYGGLTPRERYNLARRKRRGKGAA